MSNMWYASHRPDLVLLAPCDAQEVLPEGALFASINHLHPEEPAERKWRHPKHEPVLTCYGNPGKQRPNVVRCPCGESPCRLRSIQSGSPVPNELIPPNWATSYSDAKEYKTPEHRVEPGIRVWLDCTGKADKELPAEGKEHPEEAAVEAAANVLFTDYLKGRVCFGCELPSTCMKTCGRCGKARYCSRACQADHWKAHKAACQAREAPQQPAAAEPAAAEPAAAEPAPAADAPAADTLAAAASAEKGADAAATVPAAVPATAPEPEQAAEKEAAA